MVKFENVITGLINYANDQLIPNMNTLQEIGFRIVLGELYDRRNELYKIYEKNGLLRTLGLFNDSGEMDIERLLSRLKMELQRKEKLEVVVPMYGKFVFTPEDVDMIYDYINKV